VQQLLSLGLSAEEADKALRKAHGWGGFQAYWRRSKEDEDPLEEQLVRTLAYLRTLLEPAPDVEGALRALVTTFPECLGLGVEVMAENVAVLAKQYGIREGATLAGVLSRKPQVLGNTLDCSGDCAGECNRCWARF